MEEENQKTVFSAYWTRVASRAAKDTMVWFPINQNPRQACTSGIIFILASLILYFVAGVTPVIDEWSAAGSALTAALVVGASFYAFNFIAAPHRIDRDLRLEKKDLQRVKLTRDEQKYAADELRGYLRESEGLIEATLDDLFRSQVMRLAREWDDETVNKMKELRLPETEIHMFETIAIFPTRQSISIGVTEEAVKSALEAKRQKLRLIINRLLED